MVLRFSCRDYMGVPISESESLLITVQIRIYQSSAPLDLTEVVDGLVYAGFETGVQFRIVIYIKQGLTSVPSCLTLKIVHLFNYLCSFSLVLYIHVLQVRTQFPYGLV